MAWRDETTWGWGQNSNLIYNLPSLFVRIIFHQVKVEDIQYNLSISPVISAWTTAKMCTK